MHGYFESCKLFLQISSKYFATTAAAVGPLTSDRSFRAPGMMTPHVLRGGRATLSGLSKMDENAVRELLDRLLAPGSARSVWSPCRSATTASRCACRFPANSAIRAASSVAVFTAAADTAMVVAISAALGEFRPMTTVSLNTNFMRPVRKGDVLVTARVLRMGRNLVFGEVELFDEDGKMAVHATSTYALVS